MDTPSPPPSPPPPRTDPGPGPEITVVGDLGAATIGIRELRAALPESIRRAAAGQRTIVTTNGRPTAQLGPLDADAPDLDRLIGAGAVIPPRRSTEFRPPDAVPVWAGSRIDQVLRELRG